MVWPGLKLVRALPALHEPSTKVPSVMARNDAAACLSSAFCGSAVAVAVAVGGGVVAVGEGLGVAVAVAVGAVVALGRPPSVSPRAEALTPTQTPSEMMSTAAATMPASIGRF